MIVKHGKEYYPLGIGKIRKDGRTYYDRSERHKPYFYLDLSLAADKGEERVRRNNS